MKLTESEINRQYSIDIINTCEEEMRDFLFTLGCYPGEEITLISRVSSSYVINIKDTRYSIDKDLASAIEIRDFGKEVHFDCTSQVI